MSEPVRVSPVVLRTRSEELRAALARIEQLERSVENLREISRHHFSIAIGRWIQDDTSIAGGEPLQSGETVWTRSTGSGPYVLIVPVLIQAGAVVEGSQRFAHGPTVVKGWIGRDTRGVDVELPHADVTRTAPESRRTIAPGYLAVGAILVVLALLVRALV
jgi:hypothetical protein